MARVTGPQIGFSVANIIVLDENIAKQLEKELNSKNNPIQENPDQPNPKPNPNPKLKSTYGVRYETGSDDRSIVVHGLFFKNGERLPSIMGSMFRHAYMNIEDRDVLSTERVGKMMN